MAKKEDLLFSVTEKNLTVEYFSGKGGGGQHRNKHQNCVRMLHIDSGVRTTGQSNKERPANRREAFRSLTIHPLFKAWLSRRLEEIRTGKTIGQLVEEMMLPKNLKVEYKINEIWQTQEVSQ